MSLSNKVQLIGTIVDAPKVKKLLTEKASNKVSFTILSDAQTLDDNGYRTRTPQKFDVVAYGKAGEIAEKYLSKNQQVAIEGFLFVEDGKVCIEADQILLMGRQ